jgi:integrase/recombinase XerD
LQISADKILSASEVENLLTMLHERASAKHQDSWASDQLDELISVALLSSGLRNSELCALTLSRTVIGMNESVFVVHGDPPDGRVVCVPRRTSELVQEYAEAVRPNFTPDGWAADDLTCPLLLNEHRRPFDRASLYRRVVKILTQAGLGERANVQLLRHTYGYLAYLRTGGNLLFVQRQLGHAHPATTSAYAELVKESYSDLAELVLPGEWPSASPPKRARPKRVPRFDCETD